MTDTEKKLLQAQHRLEEAQARDRVKERKARTRRLIQEGAILEKVLPEVRTMELPALEGYLSRKLGKKSKFQMGGLRETGGLPLFLPKGALTHHPEGAVVFPAEIVRSARRMRLLRQPPDNATAPASAAVIVCAGRSCFRFGNSLLPARTNLPPAALFAAMTRSSTSGHFLLDTKENPRLCRGDTKAYGVEESKKEKVSKLE